MQHYKVRNKSERESDVVVLKWGKCPFLYYTENKYSNWIDTNILRNHAYVQYVIVPWISSDLLIISIRGLIRRLFLKSLYLNQLLSANMLTDSVSKNRLKQADTCKIATPFQNLTDLRLKDDPFWVREFAPFIIEKIPTFSLKWVRAYALIGRGCRGWGGGGVCGCGALYQSVYKAYVISLSILRVLCLLFLYVVVNVELMRFRGPYY